MNEMAFVVPLHEEELYYGSWVTFEVEFSGPESVIEDAIKGIDWEDESVIVIRLIRAAMADVGAKIVDIRPAKYVVMGQA